MGDKLNRRQIIWIALFLLYFVQCRNATSEFDLPVAKIFEVDEDDQILRQWDKIVNNEAIIEGVNSLRLECSASHPVQWIYSGNGIPVSSSKITFSRTRVSRELETVHKAAVFINPLKEHHTGKYQCSSTEIIDLETYFYLFVPGQALFTSLNGKNIRIRKNESSVVIPCTVSNPNAIVTLEKQIGQTLQRVEAKSPESIVYNPRVGFTIKLDELKEAPEGIFVCTAKYKNLVRGVEYTLSLSNNLFMHGPESSSSPCRNTSCGDNAICQLVDGKPTCQCEESFIGDAEQVCSLKCDAHTDCPDNKSCFTDKECRSPCLHSVTGCGIGSLCKVEMHRPVCYCGPDFVGDPMQQCFTTLQGSPADAPPDDRDKPPSDTPDTPIKCKSNDDCPIDKQCRRIGTSLECVDGCQFTLCGINSECSMIAHNPMCSCQAGYNGDPYSECTPIKIIAAVDKIPKEISVTEDPSISTSTSEPCPDPDHCGPYSKCRLNKRGRQRCSCQEGFMGQPPNCVPNKCGANKDCGLNQVCSNSTTTESEPICLNVCRSRVCGEAAECSRKGSCRCPTGFIGDPFKKCTDMTKLNLDCTIDNDCGESLRCVTTATERKCKDPCTEIKCNSGSICQVVKHIASCICPSGTTGTPTIGCTPDLNVDSLSPGGRSGRASSECSTLSCGLNSECRIVDGKPTCFCQSGYIGTPPLCRAECITNVDCAEDEACVQKRCRNACFNKCGQNANCKVIPSLERSPVCTCKEGFNGNPNVGCIPDSS